MENFPGFWQAAEQVPDKIALQEVGGRSQTFAELYTHSNQVARGLQGKNLGVGDSVAVLLPNCLEVFEVFFATSQIGLYYTSINHYLSAPEIAYILDNSESKVLFVHACYRELLSRALEHCAFAADSCIWVGVEEDNGSSYTTFREAQSGELPPDRCAGQTMLYSSGTTGNPKGVRHDLPSTYPGEYFACRGNALGIFNVRPYEEIHLVNGPLHHAGPLQFATVSLHYGHTTIITEHWEAQRCLELLAQYRVTTTMMVPTMFVRLLRESEGKQEQYSFPDLALVISAAAACPVPVKGAMIEWLGPIIFDFYGGTEGGVTACTSTQWLEKPGTSGPPVPGVELKVFSDEGAELPAGEIGVVYMTPTVGATIPQYFKDNDKTAAVKRGNFYTLGDMGYLDDDGWLFLVDRRSDLIVSGGVNIYPSEIEQVLIQHPALRDVAVVGKPDEEWGHLAWAFVVLEAGTADSPEFREELLGFARERLAKFKLPKALKVVDELPRADNGKLYRRRLLES
jgi:long-chain acyl-CoA synthetase